MRFLAFLVLGGGLSGKMTEILSFGIFKKHLTSLPKEYQLLNAKYTETSGPDTLPKPDTSLDRTVFLSPVLFSTVLYQ